MSPTFLPLPFLQYFFLFLPTLLVCFISGALLPRSQDFCDYILWLLSKWRKSGSWNFLMTINSIINVYILWGTVATVSTNLSIHYHNCISWQVSPGSWIQSLWCHWTIGRKHRKLLTFSYLESPINLTPCLWRVRESLWKIHTDTGRNVRSPCDSEMTVVLEQALLCCGISAEYREYKNTLTIIWAGLCINNESKWSSKELFVTTMLISKDEVSNKACEHLKLNIQKQF